jgi:hypothetical protein
VGYGDWNEDSLTVPNGDVEVKYVPTGDTNLDGVVDKTDLTRALNNLGLSAGYSGGDVLNKGIVNIYDVGAILNDLGAKLNANGDGADEAISGEGNATSPPGGELSAAVAQVKPAGWSAIVSSTGGAVGSPFSDTQIHSDWLESQASVLAD